jgi:hypothetical protein
LPRALPETPGESPFGGRPERVGSKPYRARGRYGRVPRARKGDATKAAFAALSGANAQAGLALGATAFIVAVLYPRAPTPSDDGEGLRALGSDGSAFGLQVVCFQRDNPNQYSLLKQSGHCPAGSYVKLQASSLDPTVREVSAVALSDDLRPLRVFQATLADSQPVTLGGYVELSEHRRIGVAFVFSAEPLSEASLRASVERAQRQGQTLAVLKEVPLATQATQKVLVIEAEDRP